ncbi:MAG TPA: choice-of-anchor Q domain-containing protein [Kofleriaceae bacterium]|nr:choice-of-anchor Q domain-containing protein [Kofleriaceae bacterium]
MLPTTGDSGLLDAFDVGFDLHDVTMVGNTSAGVAIQTGTVPCSIENVVFQNASTAVLAQGAVKIFNIQISNSTFGIHVLDGGTLTLDRAIIHGGMNPILVKTAGDGTVNVTNLLAYDATGPLDVGGAQGTIAFSTVGATNGAVAGLNCGPEVTLDATIVWNTSSSAISGTCQAIHSTIAGPTAVTGATNIDPMFANPLQSDYHLAAGSPAIDQVQSGPSDDFEGDSRPQGSSYDIGADEYKP